MKKHVLKKLKSGRKHNPRYTKKELDFLQKMKDNNVYPSDLFRIPELMEEYFPGRTKCAIKFKYYNM